MAESPLEALRGRTLLVVEDEYILAADLAMRLQDAGAEVVGPAGSVAEALELVEREGSRLDGAVLDVNLGGERVYPVADALIAQGVRFVLTTGYDASAIDSKYSSVPRCEKPVDPSALARSLTVDAR
jgi:ActR/RegA family two-component response regulator